MKKITFVLSFILLQGCSNPLGDKSGATGSFNPGLTAPKISSISPATGTVSGGTTLTLTGEGFSAGMSVLIGTATCTNVTVVGPTQATCVTPAHTSGFVDVTVNMTSGFNATLAQAFKYLGLNNPTSGFAALSGGGISTGTHVRLQGSIGDHGVPIIQSGTNIRNHSGVIGVIGK